MAPLQASEGSASESDSRDDRQARWSTRQILSDIRLLDYEVPLAKLGALTASQLARLSFESVLDTGLSKVEAHLLFAALARTSGALDLTVEEEVSHAEAAADPFNRAESWTDLALKTLGEALGFLGAPSSEESTTAASDAPATSLPRTAPEVDGDIVDMAKKASPENAPGILRMYSTLYWCCATMHVSYIDGSGRRITWKESGFTAQCAVPANARNIEVFFSEAHRFNYRRCPVAAHYALGGSFLYPEITNVLHIGERHLQPVDAVDTLELVPEVLHRVGMAAGAEAVLTLMVASRSLREGLAPALYELF